MMKDNRTMPENNIVELRRRSQSGFLNRMADKVTPIKHTSPCPTDYEKLVSSVLDE